MYQDEEVIYRINQNRIMKTLIYLGLFLVPFLTFAQNTSSVNPKGMWYFGGEIGRNRIASFELSEPSTSFQGGILTEYYFTKQWSLVGRIKYYKTGVSFINEPFNIISPNRTTYTRGQFYGEAITIPLNLKWEFRIYKNFKGYLKIGAAYSIETKSTYQNYVPEINENFPSQYYNTNIGYGFTYFLSKNNALFLDLEAFTGGAKGRESGLFIFGDGSVNVSNGLINLGYKHHFD